MRPLTITILALLAATSREPQPKIAISAGVEEGKKMLIATTTLDGKPMAGVVINFYVERSLGRIFLGREETIDDGTAAIAFPERLPGGPSGELSFVAVVEAPKEYASVSGRATLSGGIVVRPQEDPFPRALWSPRAPLPLILTMATLLAIVWCTFAYVLIQLMKIRKGAAV